MRPAALAIPLLLIAVVSKLIAGETNNSRSNKPSDAKDYIERGDTNVKKSEWVQAIENFSEAIRLDPTNALAYECRGGSYFGKGNIDNALSDFNQAIQLNPSNARVYLNRATVYQIKHEFDKAMADFNESLRLDPTCDLTYKGRASAYVTKGEFDKGINDWNELLRRNPKDAYVLTQRGYAYFKKGEFDKTVQDYHEAIRLNLTNDLAYNNLAWFRATCPDAAMRNGKEAVEAATKACELTHWKHWSWIDTLAAAYAEVGDFDKAVKYEKQSLSMEGVIPDNDRKDMQRCLSLYEQHQPNHDGQRQ